MNSYCIAANLGGRQTLRPQRPNGGRALSARPAHLTTLLRSRRSGRLQRTNVLQEPSSSSAPIDITKSDLEDQFEAEDAPSLSQGPPSLEMTTPVHIHFGAGKLGLGLVVPALAESDTRFVILQRPSNDWAPLAEKGAGPVRLQVNEEDVIDGGLKVLTDADIAAAAAEGRSIIDIIEDSPPGQGFLVLSSDKETTLGLAAHATSFSSALGAALPKVLGPMLSGLPFRHHRARPSLYACENDPNAVEQLAESLKLRVDVIPCMVDRICSTREVVADGPEGPVIKVEAEDHEGNIVVLEEPSDDIWEVPLDGETVTLPESEEVADYLFIQKKRLVNSMHTVLAFTTMVENLNENDKPFFKWERALPELTLIKPLEAKPEVQKRLWAWAVAQILVLMKEQGVDVMTEAHEVDSPDALVEHMLNVAKTTLERFSSIEDTTTRVLGGGVNNRYHERLVPVQQGMHLVEAMLNDIAFDSAQWKLLQASGLEVTEILEECDALVEEAAQFAELDLEEREAQAEWDVLQRNVMRTFKGISVDFPKAIQVATGVVMATSQFGQEVVDKQ